MTDTNTLAPTDAKRLLEQVDELVAHAREDDLLCYDQTPSQRYVEAREKIARAVLAKWGTHTPVEVEPVVLAFQHSDGTWHDPSLTERSSGMKALAPASSEPVQSKTDVRAAMYELHELMREVYSENDMALISPRSVVVLHSYVQELRAELTTALQRAQPVVVPAGVEPVEYQCRTKPDWDDKYPWCDWEKCSPESAADFERTPHLHNWFYEVRSLFTASQVQAMLDAAPRNAPLYDPDDVAFSAWCCAMDDGITASPKGGQHAE